ncbi:MAG TPA: alpha/beta hydrolase [Solirubrobacteraceae bacterium]|nr:alpha/beta hydrolase [Solirubrobacteraceae bacterium]
MRETLEVGGRRIEIERSGPDGADAVVFFLTGTPSAGIMFEPMVAAGAVRGLRHVAYSRPGYARSDRRPGRTVADCAADVAAIADQLGIDRFYTVGWSGGGPHALACAALLGDRVIAAATLASVAPRDAEGLDWLAGMGEENIQEFGAAESGQLISFLDHAAADFRHVTPEQIHQAFGDLVSPVDVASMTGEFAQYLADAVKLALGRGIWGWFDDDLAILHDWGFPLDAIDRPVTIWQGGQDRMVPFDHGRWLADHVAGAKAQLLPDEGHLSLTVGSYGRVLDELLAAAD